MAISKKGNGKGKWNGEWNEDGVVSAFESNSISCNHVYTFDIN